ncbi:MAG: hypothetical protein ACYTBP_15095, partial [Planctomycetota bacterium]
QIYTVLTKPIKRFQLILGKLLGVILLNAILLAVFSVVIYIIVSFTPKFFKADEIQLKRLDNEFYTARAALQPKEEDVTDEVIEIFERRKKNQQIPEVILQSEKARLNFLEALTAEVKRLKNAAVPGREVVWTFENIKLLDPNESLFIKYKFNVSINPPDLQVTGQWLVGDNRDFASPYDRPVAIIKKDTIRTFQEIEIPGAVVAEDGYLAVRFFNNPNLNDTVIIFPPDGLRVLYRAGNFNENYIKAVLVIFFRLIFIACLGILTSTFLSFPVAILLCLIVFFTGTISGFIMDSFNSLGDNMSRIYNHSIKFLVLALPQFNKYNPTEYLINARLLGWNTMAEIFGLMVCLKAFGLLLMSLLIFSFKEVAKIIV